jgi:methyl-accepting chemotaxis protein
VLLESISHAAQQQAKGSGDVAQSMTQISRVTRQVELGATQVASSARQLVTQAEALRGSVVAFKLPDDEDLFSPVFTPTEDENDEQLTFA